MTNRKIEYWVIPPESDAEFVAGMEEVLDIYFYCVLGLPKLNRFGDMSFSQRASEGRSMPWIGASNRGWVR